MIKTHEYTLEITSYCPHECSYCSTNASLIGVPISVDQIEQFLKENEVKQGDRINISGGEPVSHPKFWDILQLCKSITKDVWVYTNAMENIRYNTSVIHEITCEANVCIVPGETIYIPETAKRIHMLQLVPQGRAKELRPVPVKLSGNAGDKEKCRTCNHLVLQANGYTAKAPCKKNYV